MTREKPWACVRSSATQQGGEAAGIAPAVPQVVIPPADDYLFEILRSASLLVLQHPIAAQAAFSALVAEGRRFAATEEGQRWRDALVSSDFVRRGRALWEASVLNMLEDHPATLLPSSIFDAIVQAVDSSDMMELLQRIYDELAGDAANGA